ncbi:glycosyltransferase family 4 protein [Bradyrhizobium manausense]
MDPKAIYYAAVAGDVSGTYRRWREGLRDERQLAETYSGQFFDLCKRLGRRGIASFPSDASAAISDTSFEIRARPRPSKSAGLGFHVDQWRLAWHLWLDAWKSKSTDVIVMDGVTSFYLLSPLSMMGKRVYVSIHTVLRGKGETRTSARKFVDVLNRWFFEHHCAGCLVASPIIERQIRELGAVRVPITVFYPLYSRADFERFSPPSIAQSPFRILYAGRIEIDKGVFDLMSAVRNLIACGYSLRVDFCGDGAELSSLKEAILSSGLGHAMFAHGHLSRSELSEFLDKSNVVVVPTRRAFPEGLNQVVIEAVLARRPVITSDVCPALRLIEEAALEAQPDDVTSYQSCIRSLIDDPELTTRLVQAGDRYREQFFDPLLSWTEKAANLIKQADELP